MFLRHWKVLLALVLHITSCLPVPLNEFYPYGVSEGDTALPANDDGSSGEIDISILFPYFDRNHDSLFVSTAFSYRAFKLPFSLRSVTKPGVSNCRSNFCVCG